MADFFEVDFLDVETDCSGDAIALRYEISGQQTIHVVDGGYQVTGAAIIKHIRDHYGGANRIDHVVVTHCDRDHTGGLSAVLEDMEVGALWMLRPWIYAEELLPRFPTYINADRLRARLRGIYSNLVTLEALALKKGVPIFEPFQGTAIGAFTVLAPSRARYLELIVDSDKTPETVEESQATAADRAWALAKSALKRAVAFVAALWGDEVFSPEETSAENEMSLVQYARLCDKKIVLTGDAGRGTLAEAADFAPQAGLALPGIDRIQIPHHGSRRNVSTELLDRWLGARLRTMPTPGTETFTAIASSAKKDTDHPRKAVVRAFMHRGAKVIATESRTICSYGGDAPSRGWNPVQPSPYPEEQES